ncbi:hypothetical protein DFH07DRAFT_818677 [Mycena maculata]|uniref:Uncharacterized protein n=1 Tax=Mycena maculata TaxID=230809 RepID=A0AAD7J6C4_9AGAR|nr:hypothetical protein DFH07DRAFT_818677 [Mycena maculata]
MSSNITDTNTPASFSEEPSPMTTQQQTVQGQRQAPTAVPLQQNAAQPSIVPFKERVIGVAKKTRGTLLGKPELKEHGEKILQGEASIHDEPKSA